MREFAASVDRGIARVVYEASPSDVLVTGVSIHGRGTEILPGEVLIVPGSRTPYEEFDILTAIGREAAAGAVLEPADRDGGTVGDEAFSRAGVPIVWRRERKASWNAVVDHLRAAVSSPQPETSDVFPGIALGDMQRVADSLADMLGGPVIVEDPQLDVIGYSSYPGSVDRGRDIAILGRHMPAEWMRHLQKIGALDALLTSDTVVEVPHGPLGGKRRLLTSVHLDGELLGIVWVAEADEPLPGDVKENLARAGRAILPHLRHYHLTRLSETRHRKQQLRRLFDGEPLPSEVLVEYGLAPAIGYALVAVRRADGEPFRDRERERISDSMALYFQTFRWGAAPILIGGTAYCLLAIFQRISPDVLESAVRGLLRIAVKPLDTALHVVMSDVREGVMSTPEMKADAERLLAILGRRAYSASSVLTAGEGIVQSMLERARAAADEAGADHYRKLSALEAYDARRNTDLTNTLATYLALMGDASATAKVLHLHPTTLRYRLRRIAEIGRISLDDPDERLVCALLLRDRVARAVPPQRPAG